MTRRLLYLVTEDWYFCSHRLAMARAARDAGWEVTVATKVGRMADTIRAEGFRLEPLRRLERRGRNPFREFLAILELVALYRRVQPDLVHQVAMKPVLYGSMAAWLTGVPAVINALAGLGFVFISDQPLARALRPVLRGAFRLLLGRPASWLIVQNQDDHAAFAGTFISEDRVAVIRGAGVDIDHFRSSPEPPGIPVATLVARLLWDKGIGELAEAARLLRQRGVPLRLRLVGAPDAANPRSISEAQALAWQQDGLLDWDGHRSDIAQVWAESSIAVLPSYREGLPRSLLEAAACGRPLVATDVPGCRELVRHEGNGLLVEARSGAALADALARLAGDEALRLRLGAAARQTVEQDYSDQVVNKATLDLYHRAWTSAARQFRS